MPKRVKQQRRTSDENEIAFRLVQRATQEPSQDTTVPASVSNYMAQIGAKGGKVGGKRRLKTMTAEQRRKAATKAARARWGKAKKSG